MKSHFDQITQAHVSDRSKSNFLGQNLPSITSQPRKSYEDSFSFPAIGGKTETIQEARKEPILRPAFLSADGKTAELTAPEKGTKNDNLKSEILNLKSKPDSLSSDSSNTLGATIRNMNTSAQIGLALTVAAIIGTITYYWHKSPSA